MRPAAPILHVAEALAVSTDTVRDMLRRGDVEGFRVGRAVRIYLDSVEAFQRRHAIQPQRDAPRKNPKSTNRHVNALRALDRLGV
jgi:excisionase family DNA binding protein